MVLGFKERFVKLIKKRIKIHSIREDKKNRWRKGNFIHFATGTRTKNYKQFDFNTCKSVQSIKIWYRKNIITPYIYIDGRCITEYKILEQLAINDGFKNYYEFLKWFNKDFEGKIIHWTNFRY